MRRISSQSEIIDLCGRKRFYGIYSGANQMAMGDDLSPDIYLVRVIAGDRQKIEKLNLY